MENFNAYRHGKEGTHPICTQVLDPPKAPPLLLLHITTTLSIIYPFLERGGHLDVATQHDRPISFLFFGFLLTCIAISDMLSCAFTTT